MNKSASFLAHLWLPVFMLLCLTGSAALLFTGAAQAAVREEAVSYRDGDTVMNGFILYDEAIKNKRPGIIVVHDWWGISKHTHEEAQKYASQGYTLFIADMYGNGKTADNPKDAGALSGALRKDLATTRSRFGAAKVALAKHATVDASRIAAIGYSIGAQVVLEMARVDPDLRGVVAFYTGGLVPLATPSSAGQAKAKVLVLNGEADPFVKPDAVEAFKREMAAAKVEYRYIAYAGAVHAFNNPRADAYGKQFNIPFAYNAEATKRSSAEVAQFLRAIF